MMLYKLNELAKLMKEHKKYVQFFRFDYNGIDYFIVLDVIDYENSLKEYEYRLRFIKIESNRILDTIGNGFGLQFEPNVLWEYFAISFSKGEFKNVITNFYDVLNERVPNKLNNDDEDYYNKARQYYGEKYDDNAIYCNAIVNNSKNRKRTSENDMKGQMYKKDLYDLVGKYDYISFKFYPDPNMERTTKEIMRNYRKDKI